MREAAATDEQENFNFFPSLVIFLRFSSNPAEKKDTKTMATDQKNIVLLVTSTESFPGGFGKDGTEGGVA